MRKGVLIHYGIKTERTGPFTVIDVEGGKITVIDRDNTLKNAFEVFQSKLYQKLSTPNLPNFVSCKVAESHLGTGSLTEVIIPQLSRSTCSMMLISTK